MSQTLWAIAVWELRRFFKLRDQVIGFVLLVVVGGGVAGLMTFLGNRGSSTFSAGVSIAFLPPLPQLDAQLAAVTTIKVVPTGGASEAELRAKVVAGELDGIVQAGADGPVRIVTKVPHPWWQHTIATLITQQRQQQQLQSKGWSEIDAMAFIQAVPIQVEVIGKKPMADGLDLVPTGVSGALPTPAVPVAVPSELAQDQPASTLAAGEASPPAQERGGQKTDLAKQSEKEASAAGASLMVGLMLYAVFISLSFVFIGVTGEKRDRVTEQVVAAVSPQTWIDGKLIGLTLASVGSTLVFALGMLVIYLGFKYFKGEFALPQLGLGPMEVGLFLVSALLGLVMWSCFFAAVAATINDPNTSARSGILFLALIPVFIVWTVVDRPDDTAMQVMMLVPLTAPAALPARYVAGQPHAWEIVVSLVLLMATILLLRRLAGKIFALGILMHGKEPSLREMWRWVREA
ncbi:MAG TPA: ABC transporter permease [Gemmatales bacterium]|nr:ABC transporter permease [Gemmatales bacterium]HMP58586.1 ABC transporter permease [Gemmatales bacterium]